MGTARRASLAILLPAVVGIMVGAGAWACVPGGGSGKKLTVTPAEVMPGEQVTVKAASSGRSPIEVRLNGPDGALLGTLAGDRTATESGEVAATLTIPLTTSPGRLALVAVQPGAKWDPVVLAVARPDGTVPESPAPAGAADRSMGGGWLGILGVVGALGLGAVAWSARARRNAAGPASPAAT